MVISAEVVNAFWGITSTGTPVDIDKELSRRDKHNRYVYV